VIEISCPSIAIVHVACRGKRIRLLTPLATLTTPAIDVNLYATRGFTARSVPVMTSLVPRLSEYRSDCCFPQWPFDSTVNESFSRFPSV